MVLGTGDIAVFKANWKPKSDNIRDISQLLNIGLDAMVFVDDNPAERALVRDFLPEVTVPELPEDPSLYLATLERGELEAALTAVASRQQPTEQLPTATEAMVERAVEAEKLGVDRAWSAEAWGMDAISPLAAPSPGSVSHAGNTWQSLPRKSSISSRARRW